MSLRQLAKRAGKYVNFKGKNLKKGTAKAKQLNDLSGTQRFAAVVAGGAAGEAASTDGGESVEESRFRWVIGADEWREHVCADVTSCWQACALL